jgi:Cytochrome P460
VPAPAPRAFFLDAARLRSLERLGPSMVSRGHQGGRYRVTILANAEGARAFRERARVMPEGAVFVAVHVERGARGARGPVLVMRKLSARPGDWFFAFADPTLHSLRQGRLSDCASCHATAAHDDVFISE